MKRIRVSITFLRNIWRVRKKKNRKVLLARLKTCNQSAGGLICVFACTLLFFSPSFSNEKYKFVCDFHFFANTKLHVYWQKYNVLRLLLLLLFPRALQNVFIKPNPNLSVFVRPSWISPMVTQHKNVWTKIGLIQVQCLLQGSDDHCFYFFKLQSFKALDTIGN